MADDSATPKHRLELFPVTTLVDGQEDKSELTIAGHSLTLLADRYGTPLYLYDLDTLDNCLSAYLSSLARYYPGTSGITYAGKAFLCLAIAQWVHQKGISLDCSSAGELYIAAQAGLPQEQLVSHGVNKSSADLQAAIQYAGTIVVDNLQELTWLITSLQEDHSKIQTQVPSIWLRLRPGVTVQTHSHIQTGQLDSKFGLSASELIQAVQICLRNGIPIKGLHFHLGSHLHAPEPLVTAIDTTLDLIQICHQQTGWLPEIICTGGGWGVPYHEGDLPHASIESLVEAIAHAFTTGCQSRHLPLFHLQLEPGRSLVARAGVAVYHIGSIKRTPSRTYLLLDGGLADNPRPALYQARYTACPVTNPIRPYTGSYWLAGPFCESGDILIEDLPLPEMQSGELIAVPVSGAYQLSMSSNYNGACRPAVVWLTNQRADLIQTREVVEDLIRRDLPLPR
ncbi:MAG TPA: diaminopimelate decarboxylase [Anaerolineales bacterium]|nr:diaminopimelate decarboxylase [Anaerolineales bacterium]